MLCFACLVDGTVEVHWLMIDEERRHLHYSYIAASLLLSILGKIADVAVTEWDWRRLAQSD